MKITKNHSLCSDKIKKQTKKITANYNPKQGIFNNLNTISWEFRYRNYQKIFATNMVDELG